MLLNELRCIGTLGGKMRNRVLTSHSCGWKKRELGPTDSLLEVRDKSGIKRDGEVAEVCGEHSGIMDASTDLRKVGMRYK